ncbi:hypothetical protein GCM10027048_12880 [Hymenobacter coalescens]
MRNRICLAAAVLCALAGEPAAAQVRTGSVLDRKVTVTFNQAPLESVLRTLRRQYGVRISYSNTALNLRQPVTLSVQNQPLRAVLGEVLEGKNIGYELVGDQLVLHPAAPKAAPKLAGPAPAATTTTVSKASIEKPAEPAPEARATPPAEADRPAAKEVPAKAKPQPPAKKAPAKPAATAPAGKTSSAAGKASKAGVVTTAATHSAKAKPATTGGTTAVLANTATPAPAEDAGATASTTPPIAPPPAAGSEAAAGPVPALPGAAAVPADSAQQAATPPAEPEEEPARPTYTKPAQISFLGPLGSNGLRSGQTVNKVSINVLGGYAAGVEGFEAAGLFNIDRDTVSGVQVAGLANIVGRNLEGFQAAGLANVLGGTGTGWQAAGLLNVATRPVAGAQTAGLFNFVGPRKKNVMAEATASTASGGLAEAPAPGGKPAVQAAGLFNVSLAEMRGGQAAGLFNVANVTNGVQAAGLFNVAGTVRGVQVAGLLNIADSVQGVSLAPLNFVVHGYHRLEVTHSETWPVSATLKLGGSAAFYTFFTGAYDGFGSGPRRWGVGYGIGTDMWARRRLSLSLDAVGMHVNEEQRGITRALNLHNQLRVLAGFAPFRRDGHLRLVAGPTVSVLVTQRYDTAEGRVYSNLSQGRKLWLNEGNAVTKVLGWYGYSVGLRF